MTDEVLLRRAADGDETAFLLLYERHREVIFRFAFRFCGSQTAAEDVTQDTFLRLIREPGKFDSSRASLRTYLCAIARHVALTLRRRSGGALDDLGDERVEGASQDTGPLNALLDHELTHVVRRAVLDLPARQREVVVLFEYEDLSVAEIAAIVGVGTGAVKARLHRARASLRRQLGPYLSKVPARRERKRRHEP